MRRGKVRTDPKNDHLEAAEAKGRVGEGDADVDEFADVVKVERLGVVVVTVPVEVETISLGREKPATRGEGTHQMQFSRPRRSHASANAPEIHTTAIEKSMSSSMRVWLMIPATPPWRKRRGVTRKRPKRTPGVPIPKAITAMRDPHAGLITGVALL